MPKRSNDFQRLVTVIHEAISHVEGASVTESAMLAEPDGTLREIDIILERKVAGVSIRLAVECRDRSRVSDVEWIDSLVGKFRNLKVDKVVSVCKKGFSAAATAKATANNIELRVLTECLTHEWSSEFIRIGIAAFSWKPQLRSADITFDSPPKDGFEWTSPIEVLDGAASTVEKLVTACFANHVVPGMKQRMESEVSSRKLTLADLSRQWEFTAPVDIAETWFIDENGERHQIRHIVFDVVCECCADVTPVKHFQYGDTALVAEAHLTMGSDVHQVSLVQIAGQQSVRTTVTKVQAKK